MKALPLDFYLRTDTVQVARDLLGKVILTRFHGLRTAGIIIETEAYCGVEDRASHAFGGRRTARNEPMYGRGGTAYVYLCYGMHHLFNAVTNAAGEPHAVLVRALHPLEGVEAMAVRRRNAPKLCAGPGTLSQALGIETSVSGTDLLTGPIRLLDAGIRVPFQAIRTGPRIGVDFAGEDALLPYRFRIAPSQLERST
jgi:DNA-3-methyladenine glycosylase